MFYEITTLSIRFGTAAKVNEGIARFVNAPEAKGTLLGCWHSDIGQLNRCLILRSFPDFEALMSERERVMGTTNPFDCGDAIKDMSFDTYKPFPFLPAVEPGHFGSVYEIRTYKLKLGGLPHTIAAWEAAMPERSKFSKLSIAMHSIDGPPRFTHIWPYDGLDARGAIRTDSVVKGAWPPKGGPDWLTGDMESTIGIAAPISPLS